MKIYSAQLKGTTTVATGSNVSLTGSFSGSIAGIDINATNQFTASTSTRLTNIEIISASNINRITSLETKSASVDISISNINSVTSSFSPRVLNLESKSASVDISISNINSVTASNIARLSNLETKSSSIDISVSSINSKTGSYATTGSNTFFGTQTYSGSVYIANDLIVQGSSSIQYISASSVSIGTNIVQLNTANPSVRYAGLSIIDSGSIGGSGSFLYDSVQDEFIFVHRGNGTNITSSHFVLGPETYDSLGNETYLTSNIIPKGTGKEHLIDSCIFDNGTTTCIKNNLIGTGTIKGIQGIFQNSGYNLPLNILGNDGYSANLYLQSGTGAGWNDIRATNTAGGVWFGVMRDDGIAPFDCGTGYAGYIGTSVAKDFIITSNSIPRVNITSNGVACFSSTVCALRFLWSSGSTESFLTTGGGNTAIGNGGTAGLTLYSSNTPRLTISATGDSTFTCRVYATGLSTNASLTMDCSAPLSFSGTGGYIYMYSRRTGGSCGAILINNGTGQNLWFGEVGSSTYSFGLNPAGTDYTGTPTLNIDILNGRIGIGRVSPSAKLEIEIPTTNTQGGCFAASSINLVDPTTVGAYSQITFGYPGGRCWAASYIGHVSTNSYSGGYGDLVFGTRNCGNDIQPTEKLRITSNNSIVGYSQWYTTYTKSLATSDGGTQTARIIEDSLGQWIQVGRFGTPGYTTIAGTWSSVRGLSTSLAQDAATEFSADWGGSKPTEIRIMGATDFCKWRETRTIDFIYRNIPGRPWCVFFNGGSTNGNVLVCGVARYGFNTCGNYDGFGRWNSHDTCMIGMSDGEYCNPSSAYTSPSGSAFNWYTTQDAKLSAGHVAGYAGQDSSWTTSFGYDDGTAHFNDVFPSQTSQGGAGVTMSSAVWILLKFN